MKKQKSILLSILIACGILFVSDFVLFLSELISELLFFILAAIALLPFIICVILFTRLLKKIKAAKNGEAAAASAPINAAKGADSAAMPLGDAELNKKADENDELEKKAREDSELDKKMRELYEMLGLKVQYNEDGSIKDLYQLLGIEPIFDEEGNRVETIYEQLGIAPRFDENGNEIPQVFVIKNRVKRIAKVDITSRVMTRKVPVEEQEIIVIRETLKKKLEEAQKSGDKVQEQNIRKILDKTRKEGKGEKDEKFDEKRPDKVDENEEGNEEKASPKKKGKGAEKSSSGGKPSSGSAPKKSAVIKYSAPKSKGKAVSQGQLKVGKSKGNASDQTAVGVAIGQIFSLITREKPREEKQEQGDSNKAEPNKTIIDKPAQGKTPPPDKTTQSEPYHDNVRPNIQRMNPYRSPVNNIPTLTRNEPQEKFDKNNIQSFVLNDLPEKKLERQENSRGKEDNQKEVESNILHIRFAPAKEVEVIKPEIKPDDDPFKHKFGFEKEIKLDEDQTAQVEEEKEKERQRELGKA